MPSIIQTVPVATAGVDLQSSKPLPDAREAEAHDRSLVGGLLAFTATAARAVGTGVAQEGAAVAAGAAYWGPLILVAIAGAVMLAPRELADGMLTEEQRRARQALPAGGASAAGDALAVPRAPLVSPAVDQPLYQPLRSSDRWPACPVQASRVWIDETGQFVSDEEFQSRFAAAPALAQAAADHPYPSFWQLAPYVEPEDGDPEPISLESMLRKLKSSGDVKPGKGKDGPMSVESMPWKLEFPDPLREQAGLFGFQPIEPAEVPELN